MLLYLAKLNWITSLEILCDTCVSSEDLGDVLVTAVEHGGVQEWGDLVHLLPAIIHTHQQPTRLKHRPAHNHQPGITSNQQHALNHQPGINQQTGLIINHQPGISLIVTTALGLTISQASATMQDITVKQFSTISPWSQPHALAQPPSWSLNH
jgi:hypothetical protein